MTRAISSTRVASMQRPHDWSETDRWRWGYGIGGAHDAAADLRSRLRSVEERKEWIQDRQVPWDEALLALALKIQRASNRRRIDRTTGFNAVLNAMAAGSFGSCMQPDAVLVSALQACMTADEAPQMEGTDAMLKDAVLCGDEARDTLCSALLVLGFIDDGL